MAGSWQLVEAKARLATSFVVLEMDWLPVSAPLLCHRLGYCNEAVRNALGDGHDGCCGIKVTLAELPEGERAKVWGRDADAAQRPGPGAVLLCQGAGDAIYLYITKKQKNGYFLFSLMNDKKETIAEINILAKVRNAF